jgi:hypothetical protein
MQHITNLSHLVRLGLPILQRLDVDNLGLLGLAKDVMIATNGFAVSEAKQQATHIVESTIRIRLAT